MSGVPFEEGHGLWVFDEHPAWTNKNCGISDRLLLTGLGKDSAVRAANSLADMYRGDRYEVRDIHGGVVHTVVAVGERTAGPSRRRLGNRGTENKHA